MASWFQLVVKDARSTANLRRILREESRFKLAFVSVFGIGLLASMWAFFLHGFRFMDSLGGVGLMLVTRLFALFFWGLSAMLAVSAVITSYSSAMTSDETTFLFLQPLDRGQVALYKWLQAALYASWAFFFAVIPFVGAYAQYEKLSVMFALWTAVFSIPLVLICGGVGFIVCLLAARWLPRSRALWFAAALVCAAFAVFHLRELGTDLRARDDTTIVISRLIPGMKMASHPLWPSTWAAEGILAVARGDARRGAGLWAVLLANVLFLGVCIEWLGRHVFYEAWHRVHGVAALRRRKAGFQWLERGLRVLLPRDIAAIILKDARIFWRDPGQWLQGLVFFGLLALYFVNLRNFNYHLMPPEWRNLVTFLNVFSVSSVLCSFGSRFVYPQLSLEGQSFWVLGLAPTTMRRVLAAKFLSAVVSMAIVSVGLMALAAWMLRVDGQTGAVAMGVAVAVSLAVSGLSTGLGAVFLNLRQKNPAAIVSGFGGTLNLVLSLVFMIAVIAPFAALFHAVSVGRAAAPAMVRQGVIWATVWVVIATAVFTIAPLAWGARSLQAREY
jgi:ABC-2 type transport system permease protein